MAKIINEITVVNNRTNKEYSYANNNEFGLNWKFYSDGSFMISQLLSKGDDSKYDSLGIFSDFSICKIVKIQLDEK